MGCEGRNVGEQKCAREWNTRTTFECAFKRFFMSEGCFDGNLCFVAGTSTLYGDKSGY